MSGRTQAWFLIFSELSSHQSRRPEKSVTDTVRWTEGIRGCVVCLKGLVVSPALIRCSADQWPGVHDVALN